MAIMAIYDVFPFFNELDILEIRLNTLDEVVDYFLITEGTTTFSGNSKRLFLSENIELFRKFKEKIIIQVVELPNLDPFGRDDYQKNHAKIILNERLNDSDLILCGDVDEIPKPESILNAIKKLDESIKIAHFAQNLNQHYLNLKENSGTILSFAGEYKNIIDKKWLGTTLSKWSYAKQFAMNELRYPMHKEVGCRIEDGGWHFSWVGGENGLSIEERAKIKFASTSHQEFNNRKVLKKIKKRLSKNKDIIGRKHANFETITDLNYLPKYVQENIAKFDHLLAK
jgi:beta-1,4-mannosyl-glycoprotein beta-1,4-N-acetylglucosaminyltransferase